MKRNTDHVFVAITMDRGEPLRIMQFLTRGRGSILPEGAQWVDNNPESGWWTREPLPGILAGEVARACPVMSDAKELLPRGVSWRIVPHADVLTLAADRSFRDALADSGTALHHDMTKARALHRQRMRQHRAHKLTVLDVAYQQADEAGDSGAKQAIAARKQALRDLTAHPAIEQAQTVAELKAFWPEELT